MFQNQPPVLGAAKILKKKKDRKSHNSYFTDVLAAEFHHVCTVLLQSENGAMGICCCL